MQPGASLLIAALLAIPNACLGQMADLAAELLEMGRTDQAVRQKMLDLLNSEGTSALSTDDWQALVQEQLQVDETNFHRLDEIVQTHGWPTAALVGEQANGFAWLILEHANLERQKRYLEILQRDVSANRVRTANLAQLEDEIAVAEDGEQIYGSEIAVTDGRAMLVPVRDPARLDERRAAVGLGPIEDYLRHAEQELDMPVDRSALNDE